MIIQIVSIGEECLVLLTLPAEGAHEERQCRGHSSPKGQGARVPFLSDDGGGLLEGCDLLCSLHGALDREWGECLRRCARSAASASNP